MVKLSKQRKEEIDREVKAQVDKEKLERKEEEYREKMRRYHEGGGIIGMTGKLAWRGFKGTLILTKKALEDKKKGR